MRSGAASLRERRPQRVRALTLLATLGALAGCAGPGQAEADAVAEALARQVRFHYEQRLALEEGSPQPALAEGQRARDALNEALRAAGLEPPSASTANVTSGLGLGAASARARNLLLANDYVFLPTAPGDLGLALAKVEARQRGLQATLWGRTIRYRRVEHARPLLLDYASYRALRLGVGPLPPAARLAGPTVFLDRSAIARRAGTGPYLGATPATLARHLELAQVAGIRFRDEVRAAALAGLESGHGRGPALLESLIRVWLTLLRHGEGELALHRLRWEVAQPPQAQESQWRQAARWIAARLRDDDDPRQLSARLLQSLPPR